MCVAYLNVAAGATWVYKASNTSSNQSSLFLALLHGVGKKAEDWIIFEAITFRKKEQVQKRVDLEE